MSTSTEQQKLSKQNEINIAEKFSVKGRTIHEILSEKMDEAFQRRQRQKITGKIAANAMSNGKNELDWSSA